MEHRVKERLVGAVILVVIVVLVVPELLSGSLHRAPLGGSGNAAASAASSPTGAMHTVTVDLAGGPPAAPAASAAPVASAAPAPGPRAAIPSPAAAPPAAPMHLAKPVSAPKSKSAPGRWTLQIGSFADRANALRLARKWKARGYAAYVSTEGVGPKAMHRVRLGAFATRADAAAFARKLGAEGERASLVPPGH
ncbi:MAG TPA: SPOR domain-containing protein [Steroidobacteraceae bacterium]|nr:SPOR domain-containing protein [Steroidobacteraceae bacterium]